MFATAADNNVPDPPVRMTIDKNGNVGSGTSSPTNPFTLNKPGTSIIGNWYNLGAFIEPTNNKGIHLGYDNSSQTGLILSGSNGPASNLAFWTYNGSAWGERIRLDSTGNLGIGTSAPSDPLQVDAPAGWGMRIRYPGDGQYLRFSANQVASFTSAGGANNLYLNGGSGNVGIGTLTLNSGYRLDVNGNTNVTGNLNTTGTITGGNIVAKYQDVAEWVPASEQLPAGTVVVLDTTKSNQVITSTEAYDTRVAGVVSKQPAIALGQSGKHKVLVATTGRVL